MTNIRQLIGDVRGLGVAAPVRAAYEVSKRAGGHAVLFATPPQSTTVRSQVVVLGNLDPRSERVRQRAIDDAQAIIDSGARVFGERSGVPVQESWRTDPRTGAHWPVFDSWWRIDIRSAARRGDVKYVWEAARHRDLVVLARAARIDPDGPWLGELSETLRDWCDQNRPEHGVHWYSSLELSLRAIAWSQVIALVGRVLAEDLRSAMDQQLLATARHLLVELPYTLTSMRNNHLLGDALGLLLLAQMFPDHRGAGRWRRIGERLFAAQLSRHMRPDGSMIEDSLSYHRFVLEMLAVRVLLGDPPEAVRIALRRGAGHLRAIGVFDGPVPQYGDWDEGRVLASSGDPLDVTGSTALSLALSGKPVPAAWNDDRCDEMAWYGPAPIVEESTPYLSGEVSRSGGMAYVTRGPWRVWFKAGGGSSHGHADLSSVCIRYRGNWVLTDPGTGTYNGPLPVRNGLRTSPAHSVVRIDDTDQLEPHRAFRWKNSATGHLAAPVTVGGVTVLFGWHDAYENRQPGLRVGRAVLVDDETLLVVELLPQAAVAHRADLTLPLAAGVELIGDELIADDVKLPLLGVQNAQRSHGEEIPFRGWTSETYGRWTPATWLSWQPSLPIATWGLGEHPQVLWTDGERAQVGELTLHCRWTRDGAELEIVQSGPESATTVVRA